MATTIYRPVRPLLPMLCITIIAVSIYFALFRITWHIGDFSAPAASARARAMVQFITTWIGPIAITLTLVWWWVRSAPRWILAMAIGCTYAMTGHFLIMMFVRRIGMVIPGATSVIDPMLAFLNVVGFTIGALLFAWFYRAVIKRVEHNPGNRCWQCGYTIDPQIMHHLTESTPPDAICPECSAAYRPHNTPPPAIQPTPWSTTRTAIMIALAIGTVIGSIELSVILLEWSWAHS